MFFDGKAVLHIVEHVPIFSAGSVLEVHGETYGETVDAVKNALVITWRTMYEMILIDFEQTDDLYSRQNDTNNIRT